MRRSLALAPGFAPAVGCWPRCRPPANLAQVGTGCRDSTTHRFASIAAAASKWLRCRRLAAAVELSCCRTPITHFKTPSSPNPVVRNRAGIGAGGWLLLITLFIGIAGPLLALVAAAALIGGVMILNDTHWGFVALCGVVFHPVASLPFSIGFKAHLSRRGAGALFRVAGQAGHRPAG